MTSSTNGWETFVPQGPSSKFEKYDTLICVIISGGSGRKGGGERLTLTSAVDKALGHPKFIRIMTRGQNIGFVKVELPDDAYTVMQAKTDGKETGRRFLNITALVKKYHLARGVYDAHIDNGILVFDTKSEPSQF